MRRLSLLLLASLALAQGASPRDQAWYAWRAGERGDRAAIPELRRMLQDTADRTVRETVLDALIQLKAHVPWTELEDLPRRQLTRVLILQAQRPRRNRDGLLALLDRSLPHYHWTAVCNLLAARKAPGLAARLLARFEPTLRIAVVDPDDSRTHGWGLGVGNARGDGRLTVAEGWPPRAHYSLTDGKGILIAPGRRPISYRRKVVDKGTRGIGGSAPQEDRNPLRIEYLAQLLDADAKQLPLRARHDVQIAWSDARRFEEDVRAARRRVRSAHRQVVARLAERGLLTEKEAAALAPRIKLEVKDFRQPKSPPLPELDE
ncbi:MAG: hypothetical protein ACYSUM_22260 [Planctomycetota bacterium]